MTAAPHEGASAQEMLEWTYRQHRRVALVTSFQAESGVLIDLACRVTDEPDVLTLDTGRLPKETHEVMEHFRQRYPIRLRVLSPDPADIATMTAEHGTMLFRRSVELRHLCCEVRKVRPLARALREYDAWITGLRRDQTPSRAAAPVMAIDTEHGGIVKVAPLAAWTGDDVLRYLEDHDITRHPLYAHGYTSIGCAPCTRATLPGEGERAGRWWWEHEAAKECGLHQRPLVASA